MSTRVKLGLTGNQLKLIALVLMTIDHIGAYLLPQYRILRVIGRLAMPIFAWMIAEGCRYTKRPMRYFLTLFGFGLACQVVNYLFRNDLGQCILITFSLSVWLIFVTEYATRRKSLVSLCLMGGSFAAVVFICVFLPGKLAGFSVDYGLGGVLLPVLIYMGNHKQQKLLLAAGGLAMQALAQGVFVQWFSLFSLPLLALYNGQRGKHKMKWLFYIYYPLHLAVIYLIRILLF